MVVAQNLRVSASLAAWIAVDTNDTILVCPKRQTSKSLRDLVATRTPRLDEKLFRRTDSLTANEIKAFRNGRGPRLQYHPLLLSLRLVRHSAYEEVQVKWPNLSKEDWFDEGRNQRPLCSIAAAETETPFNLPFNYIEFDTDTYPKHHPLQYCKVGGDYLNCVEGHAGAPVTVAAQVKALVQRTAPDESDVEDEDEDEFYSFDWYAYGSPRFQLWTMCHAASDGKLEVSGASWNEDVEDNEKAGEPER